MGPRDLSVVSFRRSFAAPHASDRVPSRRLLAVVVAALCALIAAIVAISTWTDRERRLGAARQQAETLARVLEEQTAGMLWATELALRGIAESLRRDPDLREHDPVFEDSMRRLLPNLPAVRALFVIGADGFIRQDSDRGTPRHNLADRTYFRVHVDTPNQGLFVGQPIVSRSTGTWFIPASLRVETLQGDFAGVVAGTVEINYIERLYKELGLGGRDVIVLATRTGVLAARQPRADSHIGQPLVAGTGQSILERALASGPAGNFESVSTIDGVSRIFGYRILANHPLVVLVGLSRDQVLVPWRKGALAAAATTLAAFAMACLLLWMAMRYARREAAAQARIAEAARLEALGRLTSGVAHDFNNLLQTMASTLRLLGKLGEHDARAAEIIEQGLASMARGRMFVAQLLNVARPQELQARKMDANALLAEMRALLENAAKPKARIELELAPDLEPCCADPSRLEAAILNLVVNARDAMPPGREKMGVIRISTENCIEAIVSHDGRRLEPGEFICVAVRDDGAGMTPEVLRRAAEPFFTTKGLNGTGLGLAQVYAFVREVGGDMEIESGVRTGTTVHLYLPRA